MANDGKIESRVYPVRLTGRCGDGAQRDGGKRIHFALEIPYEYGRARVLCGATPGRYSSGFVLIETTERNGRRCRRCEQVRARRVLVIEWPSPDGGYA